MDLIQIFPNVFKATRHHAPSSHPSLARCPWRPVRARPRPHTASACVPCAPPPTAARRPVPRGGLTRAACSSQKLGPRLSLLRRVTTKAGRAEDTEAAPTGHARLRYVAATHATHTHTQRRLAPRAATCHVLKGSVRKGLSAVLRCVARRRAARKLMLRHRPARRRRPLRTLTRCARRASQPDGLRHAPSESSQGDGAEAREDCEPLYAAGAGAGGGRRRGARLRRPRSSRCRRPAGFRPWWRGAGACARRGGGRRSGRRCGGGRRGRGKRRRSDARGGRRRGARARRARCCCSVGLQARAPGGVEQAAAAGAVEGAGAGGGVAAGAEAGRRDGAAMLVAEGDVALVREGPDALAAADPRACAAQGGVSTGPATSGLPPVLRRMTRHRAPRHCASSGSDMRRPSCPSVSLAPRSKWRRLQPATLGAQVAAGAVDGAGAGSAAATFGKKGSRLAHDFLDGDAEQAA